MSRVDSRKLLHHRWFARERHVAFERNENTQSLSTMVALIVGKYFSQHASAWKYGSRERWRVLNLNNRVALARDQHYLQPHGFASWAFAS